MIRKTRIPALDCRCDLCGYRWYSISKRTPDTCRNKKCRSREWNGVKVQKLEPKIVIELPKPIRVRPLDAKD